MKISLLDHRSILPTVSAIRDFSLRILPYWLAAATTALISILYSKTFGWSEDIAFRWSDSYPALAFIVVPAAVLVSSGLARLVSPFSAGSGIPQLIAAVEIGASENPLLEKLLGLKMIIAKLIGSCLCVMGGGSTGREGPMLQMAAGLFRIVEKRWPQRNQLDGRAMILAGGAAGLASAFNTPLGGIIFAIEELAKVHISHVRTTVFHSVIIAGILAQAVLGNYLYLGRVALESSGLSTKLYLALAVAVIGALGAVFGWGVVKAHDWRSKLGPHSKTVMTLICGLSVAAIFYFVGRDAIGSGRGVIVKLLDHPNDPIGLHLGFARAFVNYFTYIGGVIGGIFAPALSTGAAFGGWASQFVSGANTQVWILAGMVAFLTGVTRTPFTSMILVLEMTDSHGIILDLMLAAIMAQGAARLIDPISFYEHMAHRILHGGERPKS